MIDQALPQESVGSRVGGSGIRSPLCDGATPKETTQPLGRRVTGQPSIPILDQVEEPNRSLVDTIADLVDTIVTDFDVTEVFYRLVDTAVEVVDADQAGLLLVDKTGELGIAAATSASTRLVELLQIQAKEGPCFDAFRTGEPVRSGPLGAEDAQTAWPEFAPMALSAGFHSVVAVPMRWRDTSLGSLNLFRIEPGETTDRDIVAARALADLTTIAIVQSQAVDGAHELIDQLQTALDTRVSIEQAKGIVAEYGKLDVEAAFERIRGHARSSNVRLSELAEKIISGEVDVETLANPDGR
jgi:transcriptional regulator with GAF, ATPase, and Fis domain